MDVAGAEVEWGELATALANAAAILTAVVTAFVAAATFANARAARRTYLASLFVSLSEQYNKDAMGSAMALLASWYRAHPKDFAERWKQMLDKNDDEAVRLNQARRLVTGYFAEIGRLYNSKLVSYAFAREITARWGFNLFVTVCVPMNRVAFPAAEPDYGRIVMQVRKAYGDGSVF